MTESSHLAIGQLGEEVAVTYLQKRGFTVVERNYRKKWGELDIIAKKDTVLHFIEVKSTGAKSTKQGTDRYRPEDHMHAKKRARMARAIASYVLEHHITQRYTADLVVVYVNRDAKRANVHVLWDIELNYTP